MKNKIRYFKQNGEEYSFSKELDNSSITFNDSSMIESSEFIRLGANGNIYIKGKLIENDIELVNAMREFLANAGYLNTKEK